MTKPPDHEVRAFLNLMTDPTKTFWLGVEKERRENRVEAFAALRRAAQYARDLHTKHGWEVLEANAVRGAIRHAINSPKASKW